MGGLGNTRYIIMKFVTFACNISDITNNYVKFFLAFGKISHIIFGIHLQNQGTFNLSLEEGVNH